MTTDFDRSRDEAKEYLRKAIAAVSICANPNTYGYEDMRKEFLDELPDVLHLLMQAERKL